MEFFQFFPDMSHSSNRGLRHPFAEHLFPSFFTNGGAVLPRPGVSVPRIRWWQERAPLPAEYKRW